MGQGIGSNKHQAEPTAGVNSNSASLLPDPGSSNQSESGPPPSQSPDFILHGIDYLPGFEKRRERRRRKFGIPRFLIIDTALWTSSYLRFLGRVGTLGRLSPSPDSSDSVAKIAQTVTTPCDLSAPIENPDSPSVIPSNEWLTYPAYPFENLVMSGGGSKGYAYVGALKALEDCGVLKNMKRIAGSSAGAICAALLSVGCTPQDIANVFKCDIKWLFQDQPCQACCCLPGMCNKYGIHPARRFYKIYGEHLARRSGDPDITFKQVYERFGCELCIVVTNLSRMCSEYCCLKTTPDLPVRFAVRMSMSFPVVFRAVRANISGRECLYADGGILDQYPISWFDASEFELNHNTQSAVDYAADGVNVKTLGLYLVSEKAMDYKIWQTLFGREIPFKPTYLPNTKLARARLKQELSSRKRENKEFSKSEYMEELKANNAVELWDHYQVQNKSHVDITNFGEYFITAIETLLVAQRKIHVKPTDVTRTVAINCGYIGTSDYVIEPGDREFMIRQGYECTRRYLLQFVTTRSFLLHTGSETIPGPPALDADNSAPTLDTHAGSIRDDDQDSCRQPVRCSSAADDNACRATASRCGVQVASGSLDGLHNGDLSDVRRSLLDVSDASVWLSDVSAVGRGARASCGSLSGGFRLPDQVDGVDDLVETQV